MAHRFAGTVDVLVIAARQAAHNRVLHELGDFRDGLEVAVRRGREARFYDVDAHLVQQDGDFELLLMGHRGAGRLLAVAQRGVQYPYAVFFGSRGGSVCCFGMRKFGHNSRFLARYAEDITNRARPLMERPGFNPQALALKLGSQRSGANKEKKQAAHRVRRRSGCGRE